MEMVVLVFHALETRTMAFKGNVKPERWNKILNPMDDLSRVIISRVIGKQAFNYDFTRRTNSLVIGSFIACLARENIGHAEIISLCRNIFDPTWLERLENVALNINHQLRIPLPKVYMSLSPGILGQANVHSVQSYQL